MDIRDLTRLVSGNPRFRCVGDTLEVNVDRGTAIVRGSLTHAERQALLMFLVDDCEVRTAEELPLDGAVHTIETAVLRRADGSERCVPAGCVIPQGEFSLARELLAAGVRLFSQPFPFPEKDIP